VTKSSTTLDLHGLLPISSSLTFLGSSSVSLVFWEALNMVLNAIAATLFLELQICNR